MPEALTWPVRKYGSAETAILSKRMSSPVPNADGYAGNDLVFSTRRVPDPPDRQISLESGRWKVSLNNQTRPLNPAFLESVTAVLDLLNLPPGWNSYSAKQIAHRNAEATIKLLLVLLDSKTPAPAVVPRVKGTIQLEWHTAQIEIEVYINSPSSVRFFAEDITTHQVAEGHLAGREEELKEWLGKVSPD